MPDYKFYQYDIVAERARWNRLENKQGFYWDPNSDIAETDVGQLAVGDFRALTRQKNSATFAGGLEKH